MHPFDRMVRWALPLGGALVLATVLTVGWCTQPARFQPGYAPEQPLPFSHRLHAGTLRMDCGYCHPDAGRSRTAGVPGLETCMGCHRVTRTDSPAIRQLTQAYDSGQRLAWKRVHALPQHVFFDHRPHVGAGIQCQSCHGEVQTMTVLERRMSLRMGSCLACHRDPGEARAKGPEHCAACHR